jgi:hypothetical protein
MTATRETREIPAIELIPVATITADATMMTTITTAVMSRTIGCFEIDIAAATDVRVLHHAETPLQP